MIVELAGLPGCGKTTLTKALQKAANGDLALKARQRKAGAQMGPAGKRQMLVGLAHAPATTATWAQPSTWLCRSSARP